MRKFRDDYDFSYLNNCTLTQIVVDKFQLTLVFSEMFRIVSEHCLEYTRAATGERYRYPIQGGIGPIVFHEILEQKIVAIDRGEWSFTMTFESGNKISVLTEEGQFESGHITGPNIRFFVF